MDTLGRRKPYRLFPGRLAADNRLAFRAAGESRATQLTKNSVPATLGIIQAGNSSIFIQAIFNHQYSMKDPGGPILHSSIFILQSSIINLQ
jgi:hypothetical protein